MQSEGEPLPKVLDSIFLLGSLLRPVSGGFEETNAATRQKTPVNKPHLGWPAVAVTWPLNPYLKRLTINFYEETISGLTIRGTSPGSRKFLGEFGMETTTLTLDSLPTHASLTLSFDLFVLKSWDGSRYLHPANNLPTGPDIFKLNVAGASTPLFYSSFTNIGPHYAFPQSYPDTYPSAEHAAETGADEVKTLGYWYGDSVYHLSFEILHTADSISLEFTGIFDEHNIPDESWGVDNVEVTSVIPEPSSLIIFGVLFGLGFIGWWKKR